MVDNRIVMKNWEDGRQNESLFNNYSTGARWI